MRVLGLTAVFVALFVGICLVASNTAAHQISEKITTDVMQQIKKNNLDNIVANVEGRDITLVGEVGSQGDINKAMEIVSHRPGVRVVMNQLTIKNVKSDVSNQLLESVQ